MTESRPRDRRRDAWDPSTAGPVNRWFLRHVFQPPGGFSRFLGGLLLGCAIIFAVVAVVLNSDPDSLQSDREFFPFIAVFFAIFSLPFLVAWFVAWVKARRRRSR